MNLTGKELGQLMHVSQQQVSRYEAGVTNLTISQLNQYLMVLGISW
ncbi:helix-turn-helix domain-containing protein [Providencia stuartii]